MALHFDNVSFYGGDDVLVGDSFLKTAFALERIRLNVQRSNFTGFHAGIADFTGRHSARLKNVSCLLIDVRVVSLSQTSRGVLHFSVDDDVTRVFYVQIQKSHVEVASLNNSVTAVIAFSSERSSSDLSQHRPTFVTVLLSQCILNVNATTGSSPGNTDAFVVSIRPQYLGARYVVLNASIDHSNMSLYANQGSSVLSVFYVTMVNSVVRLSTLYVSLVVVDPVVSSIHYYRQAALISLINGATQNSSFVIDTTRATFQVATNGADVSNTEKTQFALPPASLCRIAQWSPWQFDTLLL